MSNDNRLMPCCTKDIRNLLRAYNLLVATRDDERAIVGKISRNWLQSEREDWLHLSDINPGVFETVRGREILCEALRPDLDANPESVSIEPLLAQIPSSDKLINSNSLAKLEPSIAAEVLLGVMLQGVQRFGNRRCGSARLDHDLIIAAMIRDTVGLTDRYSAVLPGHCKKITAATISDLFGENVRRNLIKVKNYQEQFNTTFEVGNTASLNFPPTYATVIAAIEASQLRLVARAAGDEILANLDDPKKAEVRALGIDCDSEFPEYQWLNLHYRRTQAALALEGVDYGALAEPLDHTLMMSVKDVLEQPHKRRRLAGRRGKAVNDMHNNLPLVESFNASENFNSIATLHVAALEMMQYLEKGRRKSACTMLGHSLRLAAVAEKLFGEALEPAFAATAILHDVVEDGCRPVAGYDQSLDNIQRRFGGPLAAMVAELTDAESSVAAKEKAEATLLCDSLIVAEQQYNFDRFTEMDIQPTTTHEPYTFGGIITKIVDTAISEEEGIRDPDVMSSWWKHSGIRIYWSYHVRGGVVRPLLVKLTQEIERFESGYNDRESILNEELVEKLRGLIAFSITSSDNYATQNLAIIAHEYGLSAEERARMIDTFFDEKVDQAQFRKDIVDVLLAEHRLKVNIQSGAVPSESYVALYEKTTGSQPKPDANTFVRYRDAALQRARIAERLKLNLTVNSNLRKSLAEVVSLYDLRKVA